MLLKELTVSVAWERLQQDWRASIHLPIIVAASLLLIILFYSLRSLYRIHLHPLSKFPGPREAAKSDLWLYHQSLSTFPEATFEELHQKYRKSKAIRIAPNELHIADTRLYKAIYKQSNPFPKHEAFYLGFNAPSPSLFTEVDQFKHKERRRMLSSMFSRAGVLKLDGLVRERLMLLENKIDRLCEKQKIDVYGALRLLTTNIILEFCFADSSGMMEEQPDGFGSRFLEAFSVAAGGVATLQQYPLLRVLIGKMPAWLVRMINPDIASFLDLIQASPIHPFHGKS
ncbi:hypothetical protein NW755_007746 [Fusarium falciforme]|uniref:Cytochrome P450 n=1 Tax=Fusarium falciforme TaxID=195108 RepID=A0A9W8UYZ6_9HYPO|nr:hypothetical protein NW755_007746 [Fusarium falciforme]